MKIRDAILITTGAPIEMGYDEAPDMSGCSIFNVSHLSDDLVSSLEALTGRQLAKHDTASAEAERSAV